jgi:LysM repeat protein
MSVRLTPALLATSLLLLAACSTNVQGGGSGDADGPATLPPVSTTAPGDDATPLPPTTTAPTIAPSTTEGTDGATTTTTTATTTVVTTTTTTPPEPELDVYEPSCVEVVQPGESLSLIADRFDDDTVTAASIREENDLGGDVIQPGQVLDVCVDNGMNDITGEQRTERNQAIVAAATRASVEMQQEHLNQLFAGLGINELLVDGVSGPVTRQRLCAARLALGLPVSTADMEPGSEEEQSLMATETLPVPFTSSILSDRWILIDQTCQIMFVGAGTDELVFVFPTSTGEPGHESRPQDRTPAYRYNPALDNGGWHNSTTFPAAEDNPLNGNMYRPLYYDGGQAIHGANNVPTSPQSKGCARLRVEHQDALIAWLGLADEPGPTTNRGRIDVTVNVQGAYDHGDLPPLTADSPPVTADSPPADG